MLWASTQIPEEVLMLIATPLVAGFLIAMTALVTFHRRRMQRDDMEATLKMEMLERGMSAEDIERVLGARMDAARPRGFSFARMGRCASHRSSGG